MIVECQKKAFYYHLEGDIYEEKDRKGKIGSKMGFAVHCTNNFGIDYSEFLSDFANRVSVIL
ncbi:MAG: hypothetical protein SOR88_00760 [Roseburia inulinivorans]|nr:hypothetical protein [Roseburia inulinivorans]